jgi:hypothetical protein
VLVEQRQREPRAVAEAVEDRALGDAGLARDDPRADQFWQWRRSTATGGSPCRTTTARTATTS